MADTHYRILRPPAEVEPEYIVPDGDYSDTLKCSNPSELVVANKIVVGSREDCLDIVRMGRVIVQDCKFRPNVNGTRQAITLKGGCDSVLIRRVEFEGQFRHADIELGGHTIYWPTRKMRNVEVGEDVFARGRKVRVKARWCDRVTVEDPECVEVIHSPQPLVWLACWIIQLTHLAMQRIRLFNPLKSHAEKTS